MKAFRITVPPEAEDDAVAVLWEQGTAGVEVRSEPERAVLVAYFPHSTDASQLASALGAVLPGAALEEVAVPEVDWVARFREGFRPMRTGGFLIAPEWDVPPAAEGVPVLVVDPGRAFGTGTHETTRLCLAALEELAATGPLGRVLDLGTGTGLLAVAAARLGAGAVVAVDVDPEAVASARRHAALNGVDVALVLGDGGASLRPCSFDTIVANITAPLLRERAREVLALPRPGGFVVLAGLLEEDVSSVSSAYAAAGQARVRRQGEWACLILGPVS